MYRFYIKQWKPLAQNYQCCQTIKFNDFDEEERIEWDKKVLIYKF